MELMQVKFEKKIEYKSLKKKTTKLKKKNENIARGTTDPGY